MSKELVFENSLPVYFAVIDVLQDGEYSYKVTRMETKTDLIWAKNLGEKYVGNQLVVYLKCTCLRKENRLEALGRVLRLEGVVSE